MSLSKNIRLRRIELDMTQQGLADAMGYRSRSTIAKIEAGENDVPRSKLVRMAEVLDTSVEWLLTGRERGEGEPYAPQGRARARNVAVVLAGGKSTRNRQDIPNQFIEVAGKPMIIHCLETYQRHPMIDSIYVVCLKGWESIVEAYAKQYGISKFAGIVGGGASGVRSVANAVEKLKGAFDPDDTVILQESTRPLITAEIVSKLLLSCREHGISVVGESMYDYVQFSNEGGSYRHVDRDTLVCMQSPEAYRLALLQEAFAKAYGSKDESLLKETYCGLMLYRLGYELHFCEGSRTNIKAVHAEDVAIIGALLGQR